MTVVRFLSSGKPPLALPYITFSLGLFDDCQPPVKADKHHQANTPFDRNPNQINPAKNQKPKATMLALDIG